MPRVACRSIGIACGMVVAIGSFGGRSALRAAGGQEVLPAPTHLTSVPGGVSLPAPPAPPAAGAQALPINLPTALRLGNARGLDIALATQQVRAAAAQLQASRVLWLPTLYLGTDYFRHDGQNQDTTGQVIGSSRSSFMLGVGPSLVFSVSDALFAPLAAQQVLRARQASVRSAANDTVVNVAEAYFSVQQARGQLAAAEDTTRRAGDLLSRTQKLAPGGLVPSLEITRARTELQRQRQALDLAQQNWRLASADLVRVLDLDPAVLIMPLEPPELRVTLIGLEKPVQEMVEIALTNRPELAAQQALVQASLEQLRQERLRPLLPNLYVRGSSTPVTGTLAAGLFGGGPNEDMSHFSMRQDWDVQVLWQLQNFGLGNRALANQRTAENRAASVQFARLRNQVTAELVQGYALAQQAAVRVQHAESELQTARESMEQNLGGLSQPKSVGGILTLVVRPQEVVAAIEALGTAYNDYFIAIADANRAQFRLYRALGQPAQLLLTDAQTDPSAKITSCQSPSAPTSRP
jgi:outer membrane protein TolC